MPRSTRERNPYTEQERQQLIAWHALARNTRSTTPVGAPERISGDSFAAAIKEKKDQGYTWGELATPLGLKQRTLNAFMERRRMTKRENPQREAYRGISTVTQSRTETHFPCGIHEITPENSYAATREGGLPRDKWCEREKRKERYRIQKAQRGCAG